MNSQEKVIWYKEKPLLVLVLFTAVLYSTLSILRHWHFGSNTWDLGLFDQMVWHYSRFEAPASTTMLLQNSLGDHFSPILALAAPLYWLWPRAETLLVLQAVLFAIAVIPVFLFAERKVGRTQAYCLAVAFIFFWGVQNTTEYDFHPDVFAVPLIAFAINFIDLKKWLGAGLCVAGLLLVKEDLTLLVAAFGLYLAFRQNIKMGLGFISAACCFFTWTFRSSSLISTARTGVMTTGFIKASGPGRGSPQGGFAKPFLVFDILLSNLTKVKTLFLLFFPFLFLPFFSRQMILIAP
jgi:uncharacterized membrane protein